MLPLLRNLNLTPQLFGSASGVVDVTAGSRAAAAHSQTSAQTSAIYSPPTLGYTIASPNRGASGVCIACGYTGASAPGALVSLARTTSTTPDVLTWNPDGVVALGVPSDGGWAVTFAMPALAPASDTLRLRVAYRCAVASTFRLSLATTGHSDTYDLALPAAASWGVAFGTAACSRASGESSYTVSFTAWLASAGTLDVAGLELRT